MTGRPQDDQRRERRKDAILGVAGPSVSSPELPRGAASGTSPLGAFRAGFGLASVDWVVDFFILFC